jgi:hypothetical protein
MSAYGIWKDETLIPDVITDWNRGISAGEIAEWVSRRTGKKISRSAIIGKVHRLREAGHPVFRYDLETRNEQLQRVVRQEPVPLFEQVAATARKKEERRIKDAIRRAAARAIREELKLPGKTGIQFKLSDAPTQKKWQIQGRNAFERFMQKHSGGGVGIMELTYDMCRMPAGGEGADMQYCGKSPVAYVSGRRTSYCAKCAISIGWVPQVCEEVAKEILGDAA